MFSTVVDETEDHRSTIRPNCSSSAPPGFDAFELWSTLCSGRETVVSAHCSETECHLEVARALRPIPLSPRSVSLLKKLLLGVSQKVIGLEEDRSPSTIAVWSARSLQAIGLRGRPSSIPMALIMIARAVFDDSFRLDAETREFHGVDSRRLVSMRRPHVDSLQLFSPAEQDIVNAIVEGRSRKDLSHLRRSSPRTVSNQLAQIYRKLGVSGRVPLLVALLRDAETPRVPEFSWTHRLRSRCRVALARSGAVEGARSHG